MKIAVTYNSRQGELLWPRGPFAGETYPPHYLAKIVSALESGGHEVVAMDADRQLVERLADFFGHSSADEWPGMVFNLAYGLQGHYRYSHVPAMAEMLGLPYVGSDLLGHALASDKAIAKRLFREAGLPTPAFHLVESARDLPRETDYPCVVKPVAEALSLGVRLVNDETDLRRAVVEDLATFRTPVLVETYAPGREINVGILGNGPPRAFPVVEVTLGDEIPSLYTREEKSGLGPREPELLCPAPLTPSLARKAQDLALLAFQTLRCRDWGRVEMRLDETEGLQVLEVNTIPGLGPHSSFPLGARAVGLDTLESLVEAILETAIQRYTRAGYGPPRE